jgi:hypothetical protein
MLLFIWNLNSSFANYWEVLYVKYIYTPILSSNEDWASMIWVLHKWYIVLDQWESGDYEKIQLVDWKYWYVLKSNLWSYNSSNIKINWWMWELSLNTFLLKNAWINSPKKAMLTKWSSFKVMHVNYINDNYIKVRILDWKNSWKEWYIDKKFADLNSTFNIDNTLMTFVRNHSNNTNNNILTENDYIKNWLSSASETNTIWPKNEENYIDNNSDITPSIDNVNSINNNSDFLNSISNALNDNSNISTSNESSTNRTQTNTTSNTIQNINTNTNPSNSDDFLNSLTNAIWN